MKYRRKPIAPEVVDAFQMTKARSSSCAEWPGWLCRLKREGNFRIGEFAFSIGQDVSLRGYGDFDDWILRDVDGKVSICECNVFEAMYEPMDEVVEISEEAWDKLFADLELICKRKKIARDQEDKP
jgi:hypothetical protein